ncbi:MAG: DNA translocase FtsK 4TM domain-containing protein [Methylobacterium mesophilicum]|nr:DNA translocase FtsK 4TM domain-containing protein [Methylobacterium mesophilicum]
MPSSAHILIDEPHSGLSEWARRSLKRIAGLGVIAGLAGAVAALATWNVADPSFSNATDTPITNAMGYPGAVFADVAAQFWGLAALAGLLPILSWGVMLARATPIYRPVWRGLAAFGGSILAAGIAGCITPPPTWPLPMGLGGVFGDAVLWLPSLFIGAYPQGFSAIPVAVVLAAPTVYLFLFGAGLILRDPPVYEEVEEDEDAEDRVSLWTSAFGILSHYWLFLRAQSRRHLAGMRKERAPGNNPLLNPERGWRRAAERVEAEEAAEFGVEPRMVGHRGDPQTRARVEPEFFAAMVADNRSHRVSEPVMDEEPWAAPAADPFAGQQNQFAAPAWDEVSPEADLSLEPHELAGDAYAHRDGFDQGYSDPAYAEPAYEASAFSEPVYVEPVAPRPRTPVGPNTQVRNYRTPSPSALREAAQREEEWRRARSPTSLPVDASEFAAAFEDDDAPFDMEEDFAAALEAEPLVNAPAAVQQQAAPQGLPRVKIPALSRPAPLSPVVQAPAATAAVAAPVAVATAAMHRMPAPAREPARSLAHGNFGGGFEMPDLSFLAQPKGAVRDPSLSPEALQENARLLEGVLEDFGVKGEIIQVRPGPVVTLYELEPAPGIKSSRVIGLADDIARSMSAIAARVAVVPGRNAIGIELPNARRETVYLREMLASQDFADSQAKLALALGKTINGEPVITDIAKMPHVLVAGTTGSGKSVAINTMILSLLYRMSPEQCRLIMIDPKMVELSVYDGIPHLLTPVVTDPKKAVVALKWTVREMEDRYRKMAKLSVRNVDGFNARVAQAAEKGEMLSRTVQTGFDKQTGEAIYETEELDLEPMPYIVVIIDEVADLMMVAGKDIEGAVQRLGQMARAAGIHVIMATQRPSVDVITGTIKANFPTRISFQVTSKIDSRTILGEQGAEQLLGQGDMLFMAGGGRTQRVHGPFVSDQEVERVVSHLKLQGVPEYLDAITEDEDEEGEDERPAKGANGGGASGGETFDDSDDPYDQAVAVVLRDGKASTSYIQRRLGIGYNRAASIIERMEREGIVGAANHAGKREILVPTEEDKM